jgi:hypothetical protein
MPGLRVSIQKQSGSDVTLPAFYPALMPRSKTGIGSVTSLRPTSQDVGARAADYFDTCQLLDQR